MNPNTLPVIAIGTSRYLDEIKFSLNRQLHLLENEGLKLKMRELPTGKYTFLACNIDSNYLFKKSDPKYTIFKNYIAGVVSDIIIDQWEKTIIYDIICEECYYYNDQEKRKIYQFAQQYSNIKNKLGGFSLYNYRRNQIFYRLSEYLSGSQYLVIDGFIRFRLKEYIHELRRIIDSAVDDFLIEKEYDEFIMLLKCFVGIQEPGLDLLHITLNTNHVFGLYDQNKQNINNEYTGDLFLNRWHAEINQDDLLVSALISIAPRKMIIHCADDYNPKHILKTIQDIFGEQVEICNGCDHWCKQKENDND